MPPSSQANSAGATELRGADRVAAIFLTMGNTLASRLMKYFDAEEIRKITRSAADLKPVAVPQLRTLVEDFAAQFAAGANLVGTASEVERMLAGVLPPEQVEEIMGEILGHPDHRIWERISTINDSLLGAYIGGEHPQTAALILSRIKPASAAKVISHIPAPRRDGIIRRMLKVKPVADETLRMIEHILQEEFTMNFSRNSSSDSYAHIAEIINKLDRDQMDQVLQSLSETQPKIAESLKAMLFTFNDISKIASRARTLLLDKVPSDVLVLALRGTHPEFREIILSSLSQRVRKMIEAELENGIPVPMREVTDARRQITEIALGMAGRGEIEIHGEEEAFVT
jgi:flagellar motor switch protein FliG